jgi:hypothetical protein
MSLRVACAATGGDQAHDGQLPEDENHHSGGGPTRDHLHAMAAAGGLPSKAAVRRLVAVTLAGLRPSGSARI